MINSYVKKNKNMVEVDKFKDTMYLKVRLFKDFVRKNFFGCYIMYIYGIDHSFVMFPFSFHNTYIHNFNLYHANYSLDG